MRVVFILPGRGASGGVRCASIVAQGLLDRGHEVRVLCRAPDRSLRNWIRALRDTALYPESDWLLGFSGEVERYTDITACRFRSGELVVAFGMASSALLTQLSHLPNPMVQYLHGATPWDPGMMERALTLNVPRIVVASYLKDVVTSYGSDGMIAVVPNGVNCSDYYTSVPECDRSGAGLIFSSHFAKDPETSLSVIAKLRDKCHGVPIRVFGTGRRSKQLKGVSYCRYPTVQEARDIYSRSLVWIVCSRAEGFSMPVLEAMACGCAVVATDCGGPRDLIDDGDSGFLVPPGDSQAIVDRVMRLLDNPTIRNRIRQGAQTVLPRFSWEKSIARLESAFLEVVEASSM